MVDFVKAVIPPVDVLPLLKNNYLEFKQLVNTKTGELSDKKIAEYNNLKFTIYSNGYAEMTGSLHKFFNGGLHNANDFSLLDLIIVVNEIRRLFRIDLMACKLSNIELGVNVWLMPKACKILNYLIMHKGVKFKDVRLSDGNFKQADHAQYFVKIYDKGKQYRKQFPEFENELLRFELKFVKMKKLNELGVFRLQDLFDNDKLAKVTEMILTAWNEVLLIDTTIEKERLNSYCKNVKLNQWQNPNYWLELSKQRRTEQRKKYNSILEAYSNTIHKNTGTLIENKWIELVNNSLPIYRIIDKHFVTILPFNYSVIR